MAIDLLEGDNIRKCLVQKWPDFAGYGFNLHAEKGKAGQYVGQVDSDSPAEAAGLKEGDRIVEVNDVNIGNENHQQVVTRIKAGGNSVWLLVVDKAGDEYCKNNKIVITSSLSQVKKIECPDLRPAASTNNGEDGSNASTVEVNDPEPENDYESVSAEPEQSPVESKPEEKQAAVEETRVEERSPSPPKDVEEPPKPEEHKPPAEPEPTVEPTKPVEPVAQNAAPTSTTTGKMSAAEMRESLARKKKADPRNQKLSAKDKLKMFQNL